MSADTKKEGVGEKDVDVLILHNDPNRCAFCGSIKIRAAGFGTEAKCPRDCGSSSRGFNSTYNR